MKNKMCLEVEKNQPRIDNNAIDDFVPMIIARVLLTDNKNFVIFGIVLIMVATVSLVLQRLKEHKIVWNRAIFKEHEGPRNFSSGNYSIDKTSSNRDATLDHEFHLSELYSAADKCYVQKYARKCRKLIDYCPYLINAKFGSMGETPFHRVCFHGHASLIQFMLKKGANPHLMSDAGESPLCLAIWHYYTNEKKYVNDRTINCLDILRRAGCDMGEDGIWYETLLKMTMRAGQKSLVKWILTNGRYKKRSNVLKYAIKHEPPNVEKQLNVDENTILIEGIKIPNMKRYTKNSSTNYSEPPIYSIFQLWFGSCLDTIMTLIGLAAAIFSGICIPGIIILYGNLIETFVQYEINVAMENSNNATEIPVGFRRKIDSSVIDSSELARQTLNFSLSSASLALAQLIFTTMYMICLNRAALNCSIRAREIYFRALLHQSISWFDLQSFGDLAARSIRETSYLEASLGEKLGTFLSSTMAACTCTVVALYYGYKLAGALFTAVPVVILIIYVTKQTNNYTKKQEASLYVPAENSMRESLANLRSILAYSGESEECKKYVKRLAQVEDIEVTRGAINSLAGATLWALIYCMYGFAFWRGVELMRIDHNYTVTTLIVVFFCVQIGVLHIFQLPQYMFLIARANSASAKIIEMTKRIVRSDGNVDPEAQSVKPEMAVEFQNVDFAYPSSMEKMILKDVSFVVPRGKFTAIVGSVNSGKTTCMVLIHRFYDPQEGTIRLDGVDIEELNVKLLRRHVGYAQQCPVLFGTTIGESITCQTSQKSPLDLEIVAKIVGIHSFVVGCSEKYNCPLTRDLSIENRQRLALARILYRKPKILLIDNALSSLSFRAEADVYQSIRSEFPNLTIIIVTNNQRILKNVDKILYSENGCVDEFTDFDRLMHDHPSIERAISERSNAFDDVDIETTLKCKHAASMSKIILSHPSRNAGTSYQEILRTELVRIGRYPVFFQVTDIPTTDNILQSDVTFAKTRKLLFYNRREWLQLSIACFAGAILGFSLPIYTVLFGETLSLVAQHSGIQLEIRLNFFTNVFLIAGFVSGISTIIQGYMLSVAGSKLTTRMRKCAFKRILQQNIEWFDCESNDERGINSLLRTNSPRIQQACGQKLVFAVQAVTSMTVSIVLSMSYSWKMGLVTMIFTPLSLCLLRYNSKLQLRRNFFMSIHLNRTKEIIVETVTNAKCIAALTLEEAFLERYRDELKRLVMYNRNVGLHAVIYGSCVALPAIAYAISMFYGGYMLKNNEIEIGKVFKVAEAIILGTLMVGHLIFFTPNITKAQIAAVKLLRLIESPSPLLMSNDRKEIRGRVTFENVTFQHPHYAGLPKLRRFSIDVRAGEFVGLVGTPHSGVSLPIELILRFYEITYGEIKFDGENHHNFDTKNLRGQMSLVEGDPTFFKRSIADNISYGDLRREYRMDEIVAVSRKALLHDFVVSLPRGYRTILNDNIELTISQKIRLSLARALLRKPKILLIINLKRGESKDAESVLRGAIKSACEGRTCIVSSHDPFSAVQLSSRLFVINRGVVEETGTHEDLSNAQGFYTKLCAASYN